MGVISAAVVAGLAGMAAVRPAIAGRPLEGIQMRVALKDRPIERPVGAATDPVPAHAGHRAPAIRARAASIALPIALTAAAAPEPQPAAARATGVHRALAHLFIGSGKYRVQPFPTVASTRTDEDGPAGDRRE